MEANELVAAAVQKEHRELQARELGTGVVFDLRYSAHRQPGEKLSAPLSGTGETALQRQPSEGPARRQFSDYTAAQRFAVSDDAIPGKVLLQEPIISGFGVQIGPFFARPALTAAIAAVVENEQVETGAQQRGAKLQAGTDVARISMAEQPHPIRAQRVLFSRKKPAV